MAQITLKIVLTVIIWVIAVFFTTVIWKGDVNFIKYIEENIKLPVYKKPIIITPDKISLRIKGWKEISTFNVYNSSDETLYDIYVKVELENPQISIKNIDVVLQKDTDSFVVASEDISITYDIQFIKGIDSQGKGSIYLLIYSLGPKESRAFTINTIPSEDVTVEQINVLVRLSKYSKKPAKIMQNANKVTFRQFSLPEDFKFTGMKQRIKTNTIPREFFQKSPRALTEEESGLFEKLAENRTFIANDQSHYFILLSDIFLKSTLGMRREDIELLEKIGLIINYQLRLAKGSTLVCGYRGWTISWSDDQERVVGGILFTQSGKELADHITLKGDNSYVDNVTSFLNSSKIDVQLIAILDFQGGRFRYDDMGFYKYKRSEPKATGNIDEK